MLKVGWDCKCFCMHHVSLIILSSFEFHRPTAFPKCGNTGAACRLIRVWIGRQRQKNQEHTRGRERTEHKQKKRSGFVQSMQALFNQLHWPISPTPHTCSNVKDLITTEFALRHLVCHSASKRRPHCTRKAMKWLSGRFHFKTSGKDVSSNNLLSLSAFAFCCCFSVV